jgi:hypothetical protein
VERVEEFVSDLYSSEPRLSDRIKAIEALNSTANASAHDKKMKKIMHEARLFEWTSRIFPSFLMWQ